MSPTSARIEWLAATHGVPPDEALEYFLERAAIREYEGGLSRDAAENAALGDTEVWAKLWISIHTAPATHRVRGGK
jgi:hypothetical protein